MRAFLACPPVGVFVPPAIASLARGGGIPIVFGFPAYGGGPFEAIGVPTTIPLLVVLLVFCLLQILAGVLVWRRGRAGAVLALATLPFGLVLRWGFALPFGPVLGIVAAVLVLLAWPALRR